MDSRKIQAVREHRSSCASQGVTIARCREAGFDHLNRAIIVDHAIDDVMLNPIHPGEILWEEYLKSLGVSQNSLARSLRITPKTISEIVLGKRGISPDQSPRFWLNLQTEYDFRCALRQRKRLTADVRALKDLATA